MLLLVASFAYGEMAVRQTDEYRLNMQVIVAEGMAEGRQPLFFIITAVMIELFLQQLPGLLYVLRFRKAP